MSQNEKILKHLEKGRTITPLQAFRLCGTLALHSRVSELRQRGHNIVGWMKYRGFKKWGVYKLTHRHG